MVFILVQNGAMKIYPWSDTEGRPFWRDSLEYAAAEFQSKRVVEVNGVRLKWMNFVLFQGELLASYSKPKPSTPKPSS